MPHLPAADDEIGECARFTSQGLRRETKRRSLHSRATRADCFLERLPIGRFGQRIIGASGQEHRDIVVITRFCPRSQDRLVSALIGASRLPPSSRKSYHKSLTPFAARADLHRSSCAGQRPTRAESSCMRSSVHSALILVVRCFCGHFSSRQSAASISAAASFAPVVFFAPLNRLAQAGLHRGLYASKCRGRATLARPNDQVFDRLHPHMRVANRRHSLSCVAHRGVFTFVKGLARRRGAAAGAVRGPF